MDLELEQELDGAIFTQIPLFVEHVFPDKVLPLPASDLLVALSADSNPLYQDGRWHSFPQCNAAQEGDMERQLADFMNSIAVAMVALCHSQSKPLPPERRWGVKLCDSQCGGEKASKISSLLLFNEEDGPWLDAISQSTLALNNDVESAVGQLANRASLFFQSHDDYRFRLGLSICSSKISLHLFDRSGMLISQPFDIHETPELFARVLAGLMLTDCAAVGYDSTIRTINDERYIEADGKLYKLVNTEFVSDRLRGPGTICWHAQYDGEDYAIKDVWSDVSCEQTEGEILEMVKDIDGICQVVWHGDIMVDGVQDSTARWRSTITKKKLRHLETRVHRRIIMTPFAQPIYFFSSKRELLSMLMDIVRGSW